MKTCERCQLAKPATLEFFERDKRFRDSVGRDCLSCAQTRQCNTCLKYFPASSDFFRAEKRCLGGFAHQCHACTSKANQAYKKTNPTYRARQKTYRSNTREVRKDRERERALLDPYVYRARILRESMRARVRERDIPADLSFFTVAYLADWLRRTSNCPCCKRAFCTELVFVGQSLPNTPSLDRIIPALGYIIGNVALICWRCNNLKRDATVPELECVVSWMKEQLQ